MYAMQIAQEWPRSFFRNLDSALTMDSVYNDLQGEEVRVMFSMRQASAFSPNLSVTANPLVSWLPCIFVNSEVVLWVSDGSPFLRLYWVSQALPLLMQFS